MTCDHDLEAEYLYPVDADVLDLVDGPNGLAIRFALPCPDCGQALELEADVRGMKESDIDLPLDDAEEQYD
jgi:hypothetical protein